MSFDSSRPTVCASSACSAPLALFTAAEEASSGMLCGEHGRKMLGRKTRYQRCVRASIGIISRCATRKIEVHTEHVSGIALRRHWMSASIRGCCGAWMDPGSTSTKITGSPCDQTHAYRISYMDKYRRPAFTYIYSLLCGTGGRICNGLLHASPSFGAGYLQSSHQFHTITLLVLPVQYSIKAAGRF